MTTPTPRTDAAAVNAHDGLPVKRVSADFARQLERELAAAQERIREFEEAGAGLTRGQVGLINSLAHAQERIRKSEADISAMTAHAKQQAERAQAAEEWREAVLNELIVAHIYTREHDANPRKAVQDAITWNCQVALDPAVSSDARKLIEAAEARLVSVQNEYQNSIEAWATIDQELESAEARAEENARDANLLEKLRRIVPNLIEVARMPTIEHVADEHNEAVRKLRAAIAGKKK